MKTITFLKTLLIAAMLLGTVSAGAEDVLSGMNYDSENDVYYREFSESGEENTTAYVLFKTYDFGAKADYTISLTSASAALPNGFSGSNITRWKGSPGSSFTDVQTGLQMKNSNFYVFPNYGINVDGDNICVKYNGDLKTNAILDLVYRQGGSGTTEDPKVAITETPIVESHEWCASATSETITLKNRSKNLYYIKANIFVPKSEYDDFVSSLIASITYGGMVKLTSGANEGKYAETYHISATVNDVSVPVTLSAEGPLPFTISGQDITFNGAGSATTVTVTYSDKQTTVEVPASSGLYVKAVSYDFTQKSAYISSLVGGNPTNASTTVNGFTDSAPRYQFANSALMLQEGVYANTGQMLFFVNYGLTNAGNFTMEFLNHEADFVYVYKKKVANSGSYASAVTAYQKSTAANTSGLDARGASIYTGLDVYAPVGSQASVTVGEAGFVTYSSVLNLSFPENTAYVLTTDDGEILNATAKTAVPAKTALLVKGSQTPTILDLEDATDDVTGNLLLPQLFVNGKYTLTESEGTLNNYVLGKQDDKLAFYLVGSNSANIAYGKAWLQINGDSFARSLSLLFNDDDVTGIKRINDREKNEGAYYNLRGQRVTHPSKGLYISNGKIIVIK